MFEFAVIDSLGAEPALLYCSLGFKHGILFTKFARVEVECMFHFFFSVVHFLT